MPAGQTLVSEDAADLVDLVEASHKTPLQPQLSAPSQPEISL